jgi:predicted nucleic acid-binding protein
MASMIAKATRKLGYVLLDANVIIEAYALDVWNKLLDKIKAVVPSSVVQDEAFYFDKKKSGKRLAIDLNKFIDSGRILEVAATAIELQNLRPSKAT